MMSRLFAIALCVLCIVGDARAATWPTETHSFSNIASSTATFHLYGGQYAVTIHAASWGTVTLQRQAVDGSTMVTAMTAFTADGYATANLPPGTYQFTVSAASGVYVDITSVIVNK